MDQGPARGLTRHRVCGPHQSLACYRPQSPVCEVLASCHPQPVDLSTLSAHAALPAPNQGRAPPVPTPSATTSRGPAEGGLPHLGPTNPRCPHSDACAADCVTVPGEGSGFVGQRVPLLGPQIGCPPSPVFPEIWRCAWARCLPWFARRPASRALDPDTCASGKQRPAPAEGRAALPPGPASSCPEGLLHPSWGQGSGAGPWAAGSQKPARTAWLGLSLQAGLLGPSHRLWGWEAVSLEVSLPHLNACGRICTSPMGTSQEAKQQPGLPEATWGSGLRGPPGTCLCVRTVTGEAGKGHGEPQTGQPYGFPSPVGRSPAQGRPTPLSSLFSCCS